GIMVALFLGELLNLSASRRVVLLLLGTVWVFVCNALRATALVVIAGRSGIPALEHWHDLIGSAVLVAGLGGLAATAVWLRERGAVRHDEISSAPRRIPVRASVPALAWLVLIFAGTEAWYRLHERHLLTRPAWSATVANMPDARPAPIAESTKAILRYNEAASATWEGPAGVQWWSFFARWEPQRAALQLVRSHSPEICLPAVGRNFRGERPSVSLEVEGMPLRFRAYEFEQNGRPLYVFVCIQEDKVSPGAAQVAANEWNALGRVLAAWRGERNLGQRLLEIAVNGLDDFEQARAALAQTARAIIQPSATGR
ncbi:MAG: exosortase/archaeosortase family protein, partial [Verrucomicrobiota bacterium]|nr:exosortase/archaeosortase family protein [Verrucomicrobiota bacterium]